MSVLSHLDAQARPADGGVLVGQAARNQALVAPERTVRSIKREMGRDARIRMGDREFSPQEISAVILRTLKDRAAKAFGRPLQRAVITVPAFFNENQPKPRSVVFMLYCTAFQRCPLLGLQAALVQEFVKLFGFEGNLGIELFKDKEYQAAIAEFDKVLNVDPDDKIALAYLSNTYLRQGIILFEKEDYPRGS